MNEQISSWALRQKAEEQGPSVNGKQFENYRGYGLLGEPDANDRWPARLADRINDIQKAKAVARPLARRVVLLRRDYVDFPVPADKVREAMEEMLPTIKRPSTKMKRVHRACIGYGRFLQKGLLGSKQPRIKSSWKLPKSEAWSTVLEGAASERFAAQIGGIYHLAGALSEHHSSFKENAVDLFDISFEELVTLIAVRQLDLAAATATVAVKPLVLNQ